MHILPVGLTLLLTACGTTETGPSAGARGGDAHLWAVQVAENPQGFARLLERTGRDGWVALHAHRASEAVEAFAGDDPAVARSRARAEWALALLHDDLARLSGEAHARLFTAWQARGGLPQGSIAPAVAAMGLRCGGRDASAWSQAQVPKAWAPLLERVAGGEDPLAITDVAPWSERLATWSDDPTGKLPQAAAVPLLVESSGGVERTWYDPCVHRALSDAWMARAVADLGGEDWRAAAAWAEGGLEGMLFAPWTDGAALTAQIASAGSPGLIGSAMPELTTLHHEDTVPPEDDVQRARDEVRLLDAALDARREKLTAEVGPDGQALLVDLDLFARFRQEVLVSRARRHLVEDRPHMALATLQLARDVSERGVGPANSPSLLALTADAQLRAGRTREALDALTAIEAVHPEVVGLKELVGDLAVLESMGRSGDSKEN